MYTHSFLLHRGSMQSGEATVLTDAFALGVTVLMALTGLPTVNIRQRCRHMQKWPTQPSRWQAPGVPDAEAGSWDEAVAIGLAEIVVGLDAHWEEDRMPLPEVLDRLEAMAAASSADAPAAASADIPAVEMEEFVEARLCIICEEAPREVRFACGHATVCAGCLPNVVEQYRKCPMCNVAFGAQPVAEHGAHVRTAPTFVLPA